MADILQFKPKAQPTEWALVDPNTKSSNAGHVAFELGFHPGEHRVAWNVALRCDPLKHFMLMKERYHD